MTLLLFAAAAFAVAAALVLRARAVYAEVRASFRDAGRDLDLTYHETALGMPSLIGARRKRRLIVELAARPWSAPDAIRVTWDGRAHLHAGLVASPELIDAIVTLLAEGAARDAERAGGAGIREGEEGDAHAPTE